MKTEPPCVQYPTMHTIVGRKKNITKTSPSPRSKDIKVVIEVVLKFGFYATAKLIRARRQGCFLGKNYGNSCSGTKQELTKNSCNLRGMGKIQTPRRPVPPLTPQVLTMFCLSTC